MVTRTVTHETTPGLKMSNQAWVTLATNDSYGLGALVLAHSLRRVGSAHPAVVLITPSVTEAMRERLRAVFAEVIIVDVLDSGDAAHLALLQRPELGITFTKIHCWNLTQYEKGVFLDADTLVVQNCDELFEREELSAAPDVGWPDCFNSGVFVFKPSAETFSNLITFASERGSFDGGDQGLLNSYFSNWAHGDINKHLPFLYNVTSAAFYSYLPALKQFGQNIKIIHFIGAAKPWLQQFNWGTRSVEAPEHLRDFLQLWWDLFVAQVHTQLDISMDFTVHDRKYLAIAFIKSNKSIHSHISLRSYQYNMCSKHTLQDSNIEEEDNIEEDSSAHSAVQEQESAEFREPVMHNIYYEPILDPTSEFPWHHPDNQILDSDINVPDIDMSEFHDPWNIYRGNIPPSTEQCAPTEQTIDDYQDMRKYAWDYMPPQLEQRKSDSIYSYEQRSQNHHQHLLEHIETNKTYPTSYHSEHIHQSHISPFHSESPNIEQHTEPYHDNICDNSQQHSQNTQMHTLHNYDEQQKHEHQEPYHSHEHHYTYIDRSQNNESCSNEQNFESQSNNHVSNIFSDVHGKEGSIEHKKRDLTFASYYQQQNKTEQVYTVMMDHVKIKCQHSRLIETKVNGYDSDSDSDVYEELRPRHPYDGFYLRHRMTIDSRGRKVCIHEIPFIPRSPSPASSEEYEDALETVVEDINDKAINNEENQTGVAGNLARVVPGAPLQQEAADELARRQGWEAGNIDYMGADSFDNIWAKISQTLNQPDSQSDQSSEPQSETATQASENVAVDANVDVVETVSENQTVLPTAEKEVIPSDVGIAAEVPKAIDIDAPEKAAELVASVPVAVPTPATEPKPVEVPVPASKATPSGNIEEPIPVPVEMAAEIPEIVDGVAPVESSSPIVVKEKSEQTEIPVAALEALKIDEPLADALLPVTVVEQSPVPEPTPVAPEPIPAASEITPETPVPKAEAGSDSPPLANTPSKEEIPEAPIAKTEERRKPAGKLQLRPPVAADPLPTPDSELEDAASLAHAIIAGELRTPTVTAPSPPALSPASPAAPAAQLSRLSVQEPEVPTPPVDPVALSQIGVKPKPSTAALIESSVTAKSEAAPKSPETPDAPKKKVVKKVLKKDKEGASSAEAPVPPPRKKEKKPKEK